MISRLVLLLFLSVCVQNIYSEKCTEVKLNDRIDCAPDKPNDSEVCSKRKCCFAAHNSTKESKHLPACFIPSDYIGYKVKQIKKETSHILVTLERQTPSGFPKDIQEVSIDINFLNDKSLRIKIIDEKNARFEPKIPQINLPEPPVALNTLYDIEVTPNGLLTIHRKSNKKLIFGTELSKLIFSDQFIQLKSSLPSTKIYGLGEHKETFLKKTDWQKYTLFNRDSPGRVASDVSLYGSHPFYLNVEDSEGHSNGVFLFNSNAMDVILQPEPAITWRTIGGIPDIFIFLGAKPDEVVREYISLIGKPSMPPFWSLGYHQCRCCPSPHTLKEQEAITKRTIDAGIPFDVQWNAKEYMVSFNDFTIDNKTFGGFGEWVQNLHKIGMHYVPIIDPGIDPAQPKGTYPPYDEGVAMDIFVKNASNKILIGHVWNKSGKTVFPDFSHSNATLWWTNQFKAFHKMVAIDGAWNDMNELANQNADGSLNGCPMDNHLETPPYKPGNDKALHSRTICMSAKHNAGDEYNVHTLYAFYMAIATNKALREIRQKRPFIISRATFAGQGKYSGHWDGDSDTTFPEMAWTIPSIMNFNMYGIPLVGGDICGFLGSAKNDSHFQELCSRWLEIGAFYPFSRNHNTKSVDQDPVALGQHVVTAAKNALKMRYSLLPYLYTLFYFAESKGDTVARPVFFEFPDDNNAYGSISETQFMWGKAFMIIPATKFGQTSVNAYFPSGVWYEYNLELNSKPLESKGQFVELAAPVDKINTAIRGGNIIAILPPKQTTTEMRKEKFSLVVALSEQNTGSGNLYWDDGDSIDPVQTDKYSLIQFETKNGTLTTEPIHHKYMEDIIVDNIYVLGLKSNPNSVSVNGAVVPHKYDSTIYKLSIDGIKMNLLTNKNNVIWK